MKPTFFKGIVLGSVVSMAMLLGTAAFAGTGVGAIFNLGKFNGVNATTALGGATAGPQLSVTNTSNGVGASGINVKVHGGKPPLVVNSPTKVVNLNADALDGMDSTRFIQGQGRIVNIASTEFTATNRTVLDLPHFITIFHYCNGTGQDGQYAFLTGDTTVAELADNGGANPQFETIGAHSSVVGNSFWATAAAGDSHVLSFESGGKVATLHLFSWTWTNALLHQSGCVIQGYAVIHGA